MTNHVYHLSDIERAEMLKNIVTDCAVGGSRDDSSDYAATRHHFLRNPRISEKLPRFIKSCRTLPEIWSFIKPKFARYHERREFIREEFESLLSMLETEARSPSDASVSEAVKNINSAYVQELWQKALERRANDPEAAITSARTLLESVCKHILDTEGVTYEENADLPKLYGSTAKKLNLSPSQHTEALFKQILGGCHSVVEGLGALRNRHSDAHGKGLGAVRPAARHAELAVNLAGAMATFLLQTWDAKKG
jgi:hypothetical protein